MASYKKAITSDLDHFLAYLDQELHESSMSLTKEEELATTIDDIKVIVLVYERYSYSGGNRLSLNITLVNKGNDIDVLAATSGGSNAVLFKFNTWGEENFLGILADVVERYKG